MRGEAPWAFYVNMSHLYYVKDGLDIGRQRIHAPWSPGRWWQAPGRVDPDGMIWWRAEAASVFLFHEEG